MQTVNDIQAVKIPFAEVPQLSFKDVAYATGDPALRPFFKYDVKIESFIDIIKDKKEQKTDRKALVEALLAQYRSIELHPKVSENIHALADENTFTVTTAHQPSLFTGPLYYIYKIMSTVRLTEDLNKYYPKFNFVPVFVSGAEDHDFDEVSYANIFNKKIVWENDEQGSVGMMKTASLQEPLEILAQIVGEGENAQQILQIFNSAFAENTTYGQATIQVANALFESHGLVVLDMNKAALKKLFIPIAEQELLNQVSQSFIEKAQRALEEAGFGGQAHAREINLFYLSDQIRNRIVKENGIYRVLDTDYSFTESEMIEELHNHPERFSPNVVMRPLYQELVLPNLAYIGGGGEIAYWLERKEQFEHFGINFPMLIRRNSVLWIDKNHQKKITKLEFSTQEIFDDADSLIRKFVEENAETALTLEAEIKLHEQAFEGIIRKTEQVDPGLKKAVMAEMTRQQKSLDQLQNRLHRAEKQKHDTAVGQIKKMKERLFPNHGLQERTDNFIPYFLKYGFEYFEILKQELDPLSDGFIVFIED
jgi:bacillithiol biosynthesis cysteine-adding enzyme BshC